MSADGSSITPHQRYPEKQQTSPGRDAIRAKRSVLIVDDHPVFRCGLREIVNQMMSTQVCADTAYAEAACEVVRRFQPQAAIVDIELPEIDGIELTRRIKAISPRTAVLVVSLHDEVFYAETCIQAGASGFIMKSEAAENIRAALECLFAGNTYFSRRIQARLLQVLTSRRSSDGEFGLDCLSDREAEVIELMGEGYNPVEIAERLKVSRKTIDAYRDHLRKKLCLPNSNELARYAIHRYRAVGPSTACRRVSGTPQLLELS